MSMGKAYAPDTQTQRMTFARAGGLRIEPANAQTYEQLIPLIRSHASGSFIYCTQDCPEVYFLSGLENPTPTMFDFMDDPNGRTERILAALESHGVNVLAIHHRVTNQSNPDPALEAELRQRFPHSQNIESFEVRWGR